MNNKPIQPNDIVDMIVSKRKYMRSKSQIITQKHIKSFYSKVRFDENTWCWNWQASKDEDGYGWFGNFTGKKAHRFSYRLHIGELDPNLTIDHLCRNKACVNPEHMEQVTRSENTLRNPDNVTNINRQKTHCFRGHLLEGYNVKIKKGNKRTCRTCLNYMSRMNRGSKADAKVLLQAEGVMC